MEDCCAVCAEPLEWVAYGSCGHREVCSTCVARLRFILLDPRCCICKIESPAVFVTKAMGVYTTVVSDFSVFPPNATEGRAGKYWYHEDTQSFFDDLDQYKMIKAMCRLSCNVCDKLVEEQGSDGLKRRPRFKNIEQLKGHLFHKHKLFMCSLCLEGRKVFVCEQKLYTRAQLNQHIRSGDSVVDGTESERGGFTGHPICGFCRDPFYGDNELYMHMSREHFTCHICQRQHPGQFDYFQNYDDLEIHFRNEHFLCENEACLAKKFVVFQSESEMKRHNAYEHGGNMSRSKRNAALQIPTSFRFSRSSEHEQRRGRGRGREREFLNNSSNSNILAGSQVGYEVDDADLPSLSSARHVQSSGAPDREENNDVEATTETINNLNIISDVEQPSRYLQAVSQGSRNSRLEESFFPPLPGLSNDNKQQAAQDSEGRGRNTMAARLQQRNRVDVLHSSQARPSLNHVAAVNFPALTSTPNPNLLASTAIPAQTWGGKNYASTSSNSLSSFAARPEAVNVRDGATVSSRTYGKIGVTQSRSASNISISQHESESMQLSLSGQDVQSANKSLVEKIRSGLGMDEDKYKNFKKISGEYRQGQIDTWEYLAYVQQFHLVHLVPELACLCPDPQKQRELMDTYTANFLSGSFLDDREESDSSRKKKGKSLENSSLKGKGKLVENKHRESSSKKETLADSFIETVRKLQANNKPSDEVEVLAKDGYRSSKGKGPLVEANSEPPDSGGHAELKSDRSGSDHQNGGPNSGKQRKKTSKFERIRLGDGSAAALLQVGRLDANSEHEEEAADRKPTEALPVRGVWRNNGGQRLTGK